MSPRKFLLLVSLLLVVAYLLEALLFAWGLDDGVSVQHTSEWMNQWMLQKEGLLRGEWIRLFTWPFIHDINRLHFGFNLACLVLLTWFLPKISTKKLVLGMVISWGISTILFLGVAPKNHFLLGSSHWIFFLWGLFWKHENRKIRWFFVFSGLFFLLGSWVSAGWISGGLHWISFVLGGFWIFLRERSSRIQPPTAAGTKPARLQLIEMKIQQSGFDSLMLDEQQLWKEAHETLG